MRLPFIFVAMLTLAACGPDINSPASDSVSGKWQSPDAMSFFYDVRMDIAQTPNGDISGAWTSLIASGNHSCPGTKICAAANTVSGRHTVVGVSMEVLGIGAFTGQLEKNNVLRGVVSRFDGDFKVTFTKIP